MKTSAKSSTNEVTQNTMNTTTKITSHSRTNEVIKFATSSRYKGVISQQNGRWGAQIYENHRRHWLGTFTDEIEAAEAYDIAVLRFRGSGTAVNFRRKSELNPDDHAELAFLSAHSKEEIVEMLRRHSYNEELRHSLNKICVLTSSSGEFDCTYLFHTAITPSDVGKLNRLVIPKMHAEKHFGTFIDPNSVFINFGDIEGKMWRFRYSYWKSSKSYVLTRGWSRFVKEKGMKPGDVVSFWKVTADRAGFTEYLIDCQIMKTGIDVHSFCGKPVELSENDDGDQVMVRLFGVNICEGDNNGFGNGKRRREIERLQEEEAKYLSKKQWFFEFV